jgi:chemotaxis protein histidine kinase CheA
MLRLRGKFILKRDALKFFAEVSDPIFAFLALQCAHERCDRIRAARRAEHTVLGMVVDGLTDLAFMMGGDVSASSEPGKGSVFTVRLPAGADI